MIFMFKFTPVQEEYPIKECAMLIEAKNRKEAELFMMSHKHKFFEVAFITDVEEVEK